jgi:hypothetical protein
MGELIGDLKTLNNTGPKIENVKFETDVPGIHADGYVEHKGIKHPKFNVTKDEFWQNQVDGRRRLRFPKTDSVSGYMRNTKYKNPFYISYTEDNGRSYTRRVK